MSESKVALLLNADTAVGLKLALTLLQQNYFVFATVDGESNRFKEKSLIEDMNGVYCLEANMGVYGDASIISETIYSECAVLGIEARIDLLINIPILEDNRLTLKPLDVEITKLINDAVLGSMTSFNKFTSLLIRAERPSFLNVFPLASRDELASTRLSVICSAMNAVHATISKQSEATNINVKAFNTEKYAGHGLYSSSETGLCVDAITRYIEGLEVIDPHVLSPALKSTNSGQLYTNYSIV